MKNIGAYNGITCFECNEAEYFNCYYSGKAKDNIYIINGTMVRNNRIIGHYDGRRVKEYGGNEFYFKPKEEAEEEERVVVSKPADIDFSVYSKVVDEFFENLERKEPKRSVGYLG